MDSDVELDWNDEDDETNETTTTRHRIDDYDDDYECHSNDDDVS